MDLEDYARELEGRSGETRRECSLAALRATLQSLGEATRQTDPATLAAALPGPLGAELLRAEPRGPLDLSGFFARVQELAGLPLGESVELAEVVCQLLAEHVDEQTLAFLRRSLPAPIAELCAPRPLPGPPPQVPHHAPVRRIRLGQGTTLATGRAGSRHPIYEAAGQHGSLVEEDEPHAETRLATSRGLSAERRGETLADGDPGPKRPAGEGDS